MLTVNVNTDEHLVVECGFCNYGVKILLPRDKLKKMGISWFDSRSVQSVNWGVKLFIKKEIGMAKVVPISL